jgi:fanconi-associated nuclease 1
MDRFVQRSRPSAARVPLDGGSSNAGGRPKGPPPKKLRLEEVRDSGNDDEDGNSSRTEDDDGGDDDEIPLSPRRKVPKGQGQHDSESGSRQETPEPLLRETAFESSLPAVSLDQEAIEEYEAMRASQLSQPSQGDREDKGDASSRMDSRQWVRGKSSIYVDAFNLALDTVLDEETHLFDDVEKHVFAQWRNMSYEAQYLLVLPSIRQ